MSKLRPRCFGPSLAPYRSLDEACVQYSCPLPFTRSITRCARFIAVFCDSRFRSGCLFNYLLREIPIEVGKKTESNFVLTWLQQVFEVLHSKRSGQSPCVRHAVSLASGGSRSYTNRNEDLSPVIGPLPSLTKRYKPVLRA